MTVETETKTIFNIPAENLAKFEAKIAKLSRKSQKLIGLEIKPFIFGYQMVKLSDGLTHKVYEVLLTAETPVVDGWTFVARIDHSQEAGNLIRSVPNLTFEIPEKYRTAEPCCDHCKVRRYRRDTFLVRNNETGEFKQVGQTCLIDFFGHDVSKIAQYSEWLSSAHLCARAEEQFIGGDLRFLDTEEFLTYCAAAVRNEGRFVSRKEVRETDRDDLISTAHYANLLMTNPLKRRNMTAAEHPTEDDREVAAKAIDWALAFEAKGNAMSDFEHNVLVIAKSPAIEFRAEGIAAAIIAGYLRSLTKVSKAADLPVITALESNLGNLTAKDQAFAKSLIQSVRTRGEASEKQTHWLNELAKRAVKAEEIKVGDISAIAKMMDASKLKRPAILLEMPDGKGMKLSKAPMTSINAGFLYIKGRDGTYFGKISPNGEYVATVAGSSADILGSLQAFAADPAGIAAAYGKKTGVCCFCGRPLSDARSIHVGYGETCAHNYALPWGEK